MLWTFLQCFSFIPLMASEEMIFIYFFANLAFRLPWQQIKFSSLDKVCMLHRGLLKEHFCKEFVKASAVNANFHFSHYKSMATISCHSNQSSYPIGTKTISFVPPTYRCYMRNMARIGFMASEEMSFENVDDDGRMPAYIISSPMRLRLRWAKKTELLLLIVWKLSRYTIRHPVSY